MIPTQELDHIGKARALLTDQFKGTAVIQGVLDALVQEAQESENAVFDVITKRILDNATAAQLDSLGVLVGEARIGRSDDEYREGIRLRIRVNRSKGRAKDIMEVTKLALPEGTTFKYQEVYPASFIVTAFSIPSPRVLRDALIDAKAAGTYGVLISSLWPLDETFIFDDTGGNVTIARGFGSVYDGSIISRFTTAQGI